VCRKFLNGKPGTPAAFVAGLQTSHPKCGRHTGPPSGAVNTRPPGPGGCRRRCSTSSVATNRGWRPIDATAVSLAPRRRCAPMTCSTNFHLDLDSASEDVQAGHSQGDELRPPKRGIGSQQYESPPPLPTAFASCSTSAGVSTHGSRSSRCGAGTRAAGFRAMRSSSIAAFSRRLVTLRTSLARPRASGPWLAVPTGSRASWAS